MADLQSARLGVTQKGQTNCPTEHRRTTAIAVPVSSSKTPTGAGWNGTWLATPSAFFMQVLGMSFHDAMRHITAA
jgi:hypothetical protein